MRKRRLFGVLIFAIPAVLAAATIAVAGDGGNRHFRASMIGYQEVPAISTTGTGRFQAALINDTTLTYQLTFSASEVGTVTQSHIHFGQRSVNGGIVVFLCSNLGNGPAGTQACPASGSISGTITSANVLLTQQGTAQQGIAAGEFNELVRALRAGVAYANVHSTTFAGGEFRGQINDNRGDNDDDDDEGDDD